MIEVTHTPEKAVSAVLLLIEAIRNPDMGLRRNPALRPTETAYILIGHFTELPQNPTVDEGFGDTMVNNGNA